MDGLWARGKRTKRQIPNTNLQRNAKLQIPKPVAGSLPWSLGLGASLESGVWSLEFGVWSLEFGVLIGERISPHPDPPHSSVVGRGNRPVACWWYQDAPSRAVRWRI